MLQLYGENVEGIISVDSPYRLHLSLPSPHLHLLIYRRNVIRDPHIVVPCNAFNSVRCIHDNIDLLDSFLNSTGHLPMCAISAPKLPPHRRIPSISPAPDAHCLLTTFSQLSCASPVEFRLMFQVLEMPCILFFTFNSLSAKSGILARWVPRTSLDALCSTTVYTCCVRQNYTPRPRPSACQHYVLPL